MEFACRVQSLLAGAEVELGSGEDGAGPPVGISDITEPFVRHHSPLVGASRRSALKWGGQLTTAGLRGGSDSVQWEPHAGQQRNRERRTQRMRRPSCVEGLERGVHLQSTSRMARTILVSSLASWASVAEDHRPFL